MKRKPLLPCPFCGGKGRHYRVLRAGAKRTDGEPYARWVRCDSCAACGAWAKNFGTARANWNMRVPAKAKV